MLHSGKLHILQILDKAKNSFKAQALELKKILLIYLGSFLILGYLNRNG